MYDRDKILVKISILFYKENMSKTDIASSLGISRPTVSALLEEAKANGIVKITINHPEAIIINQQEQLKKKFNLETVLIAPDSDSLEMVKSEVGYLCSHFIENKIDDTYTSIGIGWGSTVYNFVRKASFQDFSQLSIVPLIGGVDVKNTEYQSNQLVFELGRKYHARTSYFYAPAVAETENIKFNFTESKFVQEIYMQAKSVDIAIVSVGRPIEQSTFYKLGYISDEEKKELIRKKAIGDILISQIDENGNEIDSQLTKRMIGLTLADIKQIKEIVLLAAGVEKSEVLFKLLKQGIIQHLVIDSSIAERLLEMK
ncbi:sugar-binding protein [Aerococcus christensenii]|uniref:Sugar-binding protein n=1 Tax=Aerococcus christensenii TaxID=87541 RepID=A0A109RCE0_9LACT|nr:sugar-binding domain-containing protein [Aerococcus christensenii]AMB92483.1 hypothetical protein AWM71_03835 [Aerococcus christensenii]PKY91037.1 sugar-binding protein [Aerococcus christensenii]